MRIARVFPRRTKATPTDDLAFVGFPPKFINADKALVSVTFTWDKLRGEQIAEEWNKIVPTEIGGVAYNQVEGEFESGKFWMLPLHQRKRDNMDLDEVPPLLGLMGVARREGHSSMEKDQRDALWLLADRAAMALEDRLLQQRVFRSLQDLQPRVDMLQRLRAFGRYDSRANMLDESLPPEADLANWVKDALTHYWGGPKLTNSPLMRLQVVQELAREHDDNPANALRALLRKAVDQVRPEGERRFTTEWILYNILEMKFIEGRKVREVAERLAMSEADLYRKQRIAVEAVAKAILTMESQIK